jgi:hypothetical protein
LFVAQNNRVIGIVVSTYHFFPPNVATTIKAMEASQQGVSSGNFWRTDANGNRTYLLDAQVVGMILEEFYKKTQVMIGEAISVSELRDFIAEKRKELALPPAK